jgi:acetyl-CoA carboxylase beta subunit
MAVEKKSNTNSNIPEGLWTKCAKCDQIIYNKELEANQLRQLLPQSDPPEYAGNLERRSG